MSVQTRDPISFLRGEGADRRQFLRVAAVSAVCHVALFVGMVFSPDFMPSRRWSSSVVNVSLVALPGPGKGGPLKLKPEEASQTPKAKETLERKAPRQDLEAEAGNHIPCPQK